MPTLRLLPSHKLPAGTPTIDGGPILDALQKTYEGDFCFVAYEADARLKKSGTPPIMNVLVYDVDLCMQPGLAHQGKRAWDTQAVGWWNEMRQRTLDVAPPAPASCLTIYGTPHGLRLVYVLDKPLPVKEAEKALKAWTPPEGLVPDPACFDWTRLFFLPKPGASIEIHRLAKAIPQGERDATLTRLIGKEVAAGRDPRETLAALAEATDEESTDTEEGHWQKALDEKASRFEAADALKEKEAEDFFKVLDEKLTDPVLPVTPASDEVVEICARCWPALGTGLPDQDPRTLTPEEARFYLSARMVQFDPVTEHWHILDLEEAAYDPVPLRNFKNSARLRQLVTRLGLDLGRVMETKAETVSQMAAQHRPSDAQKTVMVYGFQGIRFTPEGRDIGICKLQTKIKPAFHPDIDHWLHLIDPTGYLPRWLSAALRPEIHRPLPALVLHPTPASGKTVLAQLLASCFVGQTSAVPVTGKFVLGEFNQPMMNNPVVLFDERLPLNSSQQMREFLGRGESLLHVKKQSVTTTLRWYPRVLITSNRPAAECLAELFDPRRPPNAADIEAVLRRVSEVAPGRDAADYLAVNQEHLDQWFGPAGVAHLMWVRETVEPAWESFYASGYDFLVNELAGASMREVGPNGEMIRIGKALEQIATNCKVGGQPGHTFLAREGGSLWLKGGLWAAFYTTEPEIQAQILTTLRNVGAIGIKCRKRQLLDGQSVQSRWTRVTPGLLEALTRLDTPPETFLSLA